MKTITLIPWIILLSISGLAQQTITITTGTNWEDVVLHRDTRSGREFVANTNYVNGTRITSTAWTASGQRTFWRTLLRFNLGAIPDGANIQSATLYLYSDPAVSNPNAWNGNSQFSGSNAFYLEKVTQPWNQNTVTWNSQPATTTAGRVWTGPSLSTTENRQINITALVQDWVNNPGSNYGVKMILENEIRFRARSYASTNHPNTSIHPRLVITYQAINPPLTGTYREQLDHIFGAIDRTQISTGRLEEYGNGYLPFDAFNGVLSDTNRLTISTWRMLYSTLFSSHINGVNNLQPLSGVNQSLNTHSNAGYTMVPLVLAPYNTLKPDALTDNLLDVQNNQLRDVAGRPESPYNLRWLFAASPVKNHTNDGTINLRFSSQFTINPTNNIQQIAVDFDDGRGYQNVTFDTNISASYSSTGLKRLKIKATLTNNSTMECYADLQVLSVPVAVARFAPRADFDEPFPATANHSGGRAFVRYDRNDGERTINRPLIVVEGYDVSAIAPDLQTNYSYRDFIEDLNAQPGDYDFNFQLDNIAGYDLIFLDFNDGADDILRNAELLEQVIDWVNDEKAAAGSIEQNVVLGISMGGLVGRYALAKMTKAGNDPETRLLITHDSPHRGANTPLGLQFLSRAAANVNVLDWAADLFDILPEVEQSDRILDAPATEQLLILRATNDNGGVVPNIFLDGVYRSMVNFSSSGPQPAYQVVATSMGAACGESQLLQPYAELTRVTGRFMISPMPWISSRSFNTEIITNALPASGSERIMKLRVWIRQRILRVIKIDINLTNKSANSPSNTRAWDSAPGGTQNVGSQVSDDFPNERVKLWWFMDIGISSRFAEDFCFVPTVSALDVTNINPAALNDEYTWGISPGNPVRVDNFITHNPVSGATDFNESHPRFTKTNAEWLFNVMQNIPNNLNCSSSCVPDGFVTTGPGAVCDQATYRVNDAPPGANLSWTTSPNLTQISGQGTNNFTVASGGTGLAWIDVTINNSGCGTVVVDRKDIQIGRPPVVTGEIVCAGGPTGCPPGSTFGRQEYQFSVNTTLGPGETSEWTLFNGQILSNPLNTNFVSVRVNDPLNAGFFALEYIKTNDCGTRGVSQTFSHSGGPGMFFSVSPNPSDDYIKVSLVQPESRASASAIQPVKRINYELKLFNSQQNLVKSVTSSEPDYHMNTRNLIPGYYILHIITDTGISTHPIIVN